jgi:hypothetical protein
MNTNKTQTLEKAMKTCSSIKELEDNRVEKQSKKEMDIF